MPNVELLKFHAPWCGPCKFLNTELEKCLTDFTIVPVNVDTEPGSTQIYGVRGVPTVVVRIDGEERGRFTGKRTAAQIDDLLEQLLAQSPPEDGADVE